MLKKISIVGILTCMLYFISVGLFLITKADIALTIWELMTVISGPLVLLVMIGLADFLSSPAFCKKTMLVAMSSTCALTGAAHIVNITVTRRLMAEGINVPEYFQIGQWPSVEMAVDYLAWGFFMGLAFLAISFPLKDNDKTIHRTKIISLICGVMCLTGFCGAIFINENIWYLAPMSYGFGLILLCIQMLRKK